MERAERLIFLGVALLLHVIFVPLLCVLLALVGLHRRAALLQGVAPGEPGAGELPTSPEAAWRRGRVESRWQAWREPSAAGARRTSDDTEPGPGPPARRAARSALAPGARHRALGHRACARTGSRTEHHSFVRTRPAPAPRGR